MPSPVALPISPRAGVLTPQQGFGMALTAFIIWGFLPLYFQPLKQVNPVELVAHRIIWAVPFAFAVMAAQGRLGEIGPLFRDRKNVALMALTAALIAINWSIYVYAVSIDRTSQAALGYYITPLMNVAMGAVLLRERLTKLQLLAVALAALAVLYRTGAEGSVPVIGLALTTSFAIYGFLRKVVSVGAVQGFLMEVVLLLPFALAFVLWRAWTGQGAFGTELGTSLWLMGCGPITAIPLIAYAFGARSLRFTTLGLMQYIAPTMIFIISFTLLGEVWTSREAVTFALIWVALAVYTFALFRADRTA